MKICHPDLIRNIAAHLDLPTLFRFIQTSNFLYKLITDNRFWLLKYRVEYPNDTSHPDDWNWKEYYKMSCQVLYLNDLPILKSVIMVSVSDKHMGIVTNSKSLYMKGSNEHGQLGVKNINESIVFLKVSDRVRKIVCQQSHSIYIDVDNKAYITGLINPVNNSREYEFKFEEANVLDIKMTTSPFFVVKSIVYLSGELYCSLSRSFDRKMRKVDSNVLSLGEHAYFYINRYQEAFEILVTFRQYKRRLVAKNVQWIDMCYYLTMDNKFYYRHGIDNCDYLLLDTKIKSFTSYHRNLTGIAEYFTVFTVDNKILQYEHPSRNIALLNFYDLPFSPLMMASNSDGVYTISAPRSVENLLHLN